MSERKCPHNQAPLTADAKRGVWRCDPEACVERMKVDHLRAEENCASDDGAEVTFAMTAAEQMEALGQEKLL